MKPEDQFCYYLAIINEMIFPNNEPKVGIIRDLKVRPWLNNSSFAYVAKDDMYVFHEFNFIEKFGKYDKEVVFTTPAAETIAVINFETDFRTEKMEIIVPELTIDLYLVCKAVHETRHRMQVLLNNSNPIILPEQYESFTCFQYTVDFLKSFLNSKNHKYSTEYLPFELDARMIERIFFQQLWINYNQRGINLDESIRISSKVLTMSIEELREKLNETCYVSPKT